jgi:hypothetical protein
MKLNNNYTGQITSAKFSKKAIKGVDDEKQYVRVGIIKLEMEFNDDDLSNFVDSSIANDRAFDSCSWDERIGYYSLNINDVVSKVKVIKIQRTNKDELEGTFSLTFETEELDNVSTIGNYLKDKDNPASFCLSAYSEATEESNS